MRRPLLCLVVAALAAPSWAEPEVATPLGTAVGSYAALGVERYGGLPYALPPLGERRFARAELSDAAWPGRRLDARRPGPPCIQNPLGDPRSPGSESPPPSEDCLKLNVWRPSSPPGNQSRPVMVYLFGGGLCSGFAGNEYFNGSNLVLQHDVIVVTIQYRLGALGFMVGEDPARPGTGGMNGMHDNIVALQWLQKHVGSFGGDSRDITIFGQSSGGYSICSLCVAPEAKGLFRRAGLLSGPCFGGPPGRGWGPASVEKGRNVSRLILAAHGAKTLDELRKVPAEDLQWPSEYMVDLDKAPYFSGYFFDPAVVPSPPEALWRSGRINPEEIIVSFTSKDGTAAFYGVAPTLGLVPPNLNSSTEAGYKEKMRSVWGADADAIMLQYPLSSYSSPAGAFIQADAEAYVICPSRRMARYAALAGKRVWVSEFAHFQPSPAEPQGCSGYGPHGCKGYGCDNGVELDVVPGRHEDTTRLWASHGSDYHYIFGTQRGPDGLGPPNNVTVCDFTAEERALSKTLMSQWASFVRHGNPNTAAAAAAVTWPEAAVAGDGSVSIRRMRLAVASTDGVPTSIEEGVHDENCDFWDKLYPPHLSDRSAEPVAFAEAYV